MKYGAMLCSLCALACLYGCVELPNGTSGEIRNRGRGDDAAESITEAWTNSTEEKITGLMTVWAEVNRAFPHRERLASLDWDATVQSWLPRVIAADSLSGYYAALEELVALLKDSHTEIVPPWGRFRPDYDNPPIEVRIIRDEFYIARAADTHEIRSQGIKAGDRIVRVNGQTDIREYFQDQVLRYHSRGLKHADEALLVFYLFYGPKGSSLSLDLIDQAGGEKTVRLTRSSEGDDGRPFLYRFVELSFASSLEYSRLPDGSLYVMLPNFQPGNEAIAEEFLGLIDSADLSSMPGMVIDLRYNLGGSDAIMHTIVSGLIGEPLRTPPRIYFQYAPALIPLGQDPYSWVSQSSTVEPRKGKRYEGPLVLLIGPHTHSSAEDMALELAGAGRCAIIGRPSAGGSGGSLSVPLPWGGSLALSSFKSTWPDGRDYMASGIIPDLEVPETLSDILEGRDPALEMAMRAIEGLGR